MMKRPVQSTVAAAAALMALVVLTACGEKPQTGAAIRTDAAPYAGTGSNFMQPGWKAGDKAAWEAQLKARQQYGQNEYTRSPNK
jgi:major membrane immunogen (membrane-anchored lipoprotein)